MCEPESRFIRARVLHDDVAWLTAMGNDYHLDADFSSTAAGIVKRKTTTLKMSR